MAQVNQPVLVLVLMVSEILGLHGTRTQERVQRIRLFSEPPVILSSEKSPSTHPLPTGTPKLFPWGGGGGGNKSLFPQSCITESVTMTTTEGNQGDQMGHGPSLQNICSPGVCVYVFFVFVYVCVYVCCVCVFVCGCVCLCVCLFCFVLQNFTWLWF